MISNSQKIKIKKSETNGSESSRCGSFNFLFNTVETRNWTSFWHYPVIFSVQFPKQKKLGTFTKKGRMTMLLIWTSHKKGAHQFLVFVVSKESTFTVLLTSITEGLDFPFLLFFWVLFGKSCKLKILANYKISWLSL